MQSTSRQYRAHMPFLTLAGAAVVAAAAVWFGMPHEKEISNLWVLLAKLAPFVLALEAIARLEIAPSTRRRLAMAAVPATFVVFFCWFVPKIFFHSDDGQQLYYYVLTLTPFVILALALAYRLGGAAAGPVRRVGYAMLLLMLSGLEDLAFLTVNAHTDPAWTPIPERWDWAEHMTVFAGRPLTKYEAYVFIAVHVVLAVLVLTLPARVVAGPVRTVLRRRRPAAAPAPARPAVGPATR